jgi:hypothetical protein
MKATFTFSELRNYVSGMSFSWNWPVAQGRSGGGGVKQGDLDTEEMEEGEIFSSIKIQNREDDFVWEVINVYGHVKNEKKRVYAGIVSKYKKKQHSFCDWGDFTMIRYGHEKSSGAAHNVWMNMFNSFINDTAIIEKVRGGSRFIGTNKQEVPIRSNFDRIFVSSGWELRFPRASVRALIRVGFDHNPLLLDDGTRKRQLTKKFRFELAWLSHENFKRQLVEKWAKREAEGVQDYWKRMKNGLR